MKNIRTGKRRKRPLTVFLSAAVFAAAAVIAAAGLMRTDRAQSGYMTRNVRSSIVRAAAACYAAEGSYPESLEYLEENYGVRINRQKYIVHYSFAGSNISPEVAVALAEAPSDRKELK